MKMLKILSSLVLTVLIVGCSSGPEDTLVGQWHQINGWTTVEFFQDGTVIFGSKGESFVMDYRFLDETRLRFEGGAAPLVMEITLADDLLTLAELNGPTEVYQRFGSAGQFDSQQLLLQPNRRPDLVTDEHIELIKQLQIQSPDELLLQPPPLLDPPSEPNFGTAPPGPVLPPQPEECADDTDLVCLSEYQAAFRGWQAEVEQINGAYEFQVEAYQTEVELKRTQYQIDLQAYQQSVEDWQLWESQRQALPETVLDQLRAMEAVVGEEGLIWILFHLEFYLHESGRVGGC
jgi:hypothetical protein